MQDSVNVRPLSAQVISIHGLHQTEIGLRVAPMSSSKENGAEDTAQHKEDCCKEARPINSTHAHGYAVLIFLFGFDGLQRR
mmetsp:Transcript_40515/g.97797  ORF Transcript_40515/g.97797 Transcript_40515/m.97797 type:complete len:81 (-) Transcript_40515:48-290(-)